MAAKTFTNNAAGARGINLKSGATQWLEPGETAKVEGDIADNGVHPDITEGAKPLSELSKAELEDIASREGVDLSAAKTNEDRVAAIEAKRAA
jgi:hypothetical protein